MLRQLRDHLGASPPRGVTADRGTRSLGKQRVRGVHDGVVGAFAITSDPIIIAIGLGIGAMFIRSLTVYLVKKGTLGEYIYLEHGALWAIGALAVVLMFTIRY